MSGMPHQKIKRNSELVPLTWLGNMSSEHLSRRRLVLLEKASSFVERKGNVFGTTDELPTVISSLSMLKDQLRRNEFQSGNLA